MYISRQMAYLQLYTAALQGVVSRSPFGVDLDPDQLTDDAKALADSGMSDLIEAQVVAAE